MGIFVAFFILTSWFVTLYLALTHVQLSTAQDVFESLWLILWIQFLYVGLFITVHDACHGSVAPGKPKINLWVGRTFAFLYAGLSFDKLKRNHSGHHRYSGTLSDPDFHDEKRLAFVFWLARFFGHYVSLSQILVMCLIAQVFMHVFHFAKINVFVFWVAPSLLSSLQLFYFGTYLPHREDASADFADHHRTRNFAIPWLASWLSCYHFGAYHLNHHRDPGVPWFCLPYFNSKSGIRKKGG